MGNEGDDTLIGGIGLTDASDAADTLDGGDGNDVIYGNGGDDVLVGGAGNDLIYGGLGRNFLAGAAGNDTLVGASEFDTLQGGAGVDRYYIDGRLLSPDYSGLGERAGESRLTIQDLEAGEQIQIIGLSAVPELALSQQEGQTILTGGGNALVNLGAIDPNEITLSTNADSGSETVNITLKVAADDTAIPNRDPEVENPLIDQSATIHSAFSYQFAADSFTDPDMGDVLTYSVTSGLPGWASFDAATRTISGTPVASDIGSATVTLRATDPIGNFVEDDFVLTTNAITGTAAADALNGTANDDIILALTGQDTVQAGLGDDAITIADWAAVSLPSAISPGNLQLWLDASDASTITETGGAVSEWADKSGNGNDAVQADSTKQPTLRASAFNGSDTLYFNGAAQSHILQTENDVSYGAFTIFSILNTAAAGTRIIYEASNNNNSNDGFLLTAGANSTTSVNNPGVGRSTYRLTYSWARDDSPLIATHAFDGTNIGHTIGINGLDQTPITNNITGDPGSDTVTTSFNIGARASGSGPYEGEIGELVFFNTGLSDTDRQAVERYLSNKYGIELDASVPNANDVIDGGAGTDTLTISSGQFLLNPGTLSTFNSIESFNLSGNNAAHEITLTDDYYDTNGGVENDLVTVNLSGNAPGAQVNAATLTGTHAISVQGSDGADTVLGGAAITDHLDYSARSTAVTIDQTTANFANLDTLTGGTAGDTITGGLGNQTLQGGNGDDRLYGDVDVESFDVSAFTSGNQLWLDANDASTITDAGGGAVSNWADKSGKGNNVVQNNVLQQPLTNSFVINNKNTIAFDGNNDILQSASVSIPSDNGHLFMLVADIDDSSSSSALIRYRPNATYGAESGFSLELDVGENYVNILYEDTSGNSISNDGSNAPIDTALITLQGQKSNVVISHDGAVFDSTADIRAGSTPLETVDGDAPIGIGNNPESNRPFFGKMAEILFFDSDIPTAARQQIETYLAEKWGIAYNGTVDDDDSLEGGAGDDVLSGGVGADILNGGADNDTLEGGLDNDQLYGDSGNDVFIFKNNSGQDVLVDFENPGAAAGDAIQLLTDINGSGFTQFSDLTLNQVGADTVIDFDPGNPGTHTLTLQNTTATAFDASDFVFI